jgi:TRAP-type mannitol/chloroaromatic compound transport system permease small subunit
MPSIGFVLPHWMFWAALLVFPVIAWICVARTRDPLEAGRPNLFLSYLFWLFGGFLGLHRFYLKSMLGLIYLPLFAVVIYGGSLYRDARESVSAAHSNVESLNRVIERTRPAAERGSADAKNRIEQSQKRLETAKVDLAAAEAKIGRALLVTRIPAAASLALMSLDAFLIPGLVRRQRAEEPLPTELPEEVAYHDDPPPEIPGLPGRIARGIDALVRVTGELVAYWAVLAVFAYYFEVIGRYVFNSPTNWVHESTFLMFGMQYMVAGAYAYRGESHVRVDLLYTHLSPRAKAVCDVIGSVFVFFFLAVMAWTGWTFASQAMAMGEVSFTEWGIQYWPVKLMIPIGAVLVILQAFARLIRDIYVLAAPRRTAAAYA